MKRLRWTVVLVAAAVLLGGCGEVTNTLTPKPGTANTLTVALEASPNFTQVGIDEAQALGYFKQTDETVRFIVSKHPIDDLHDHRAQIALTSEPEIIAARNRHTALASVAAVLQGPEQIAVVCGKNGNSGKSGKGRTSSKGTTSSKGSTSTSASSGAKPDASSSTTARAHPPLEATQCRAQTDAHPLAAYASAPTYNRLNFVVTEDEIVNYAPVIRRFVQAVARGYEAAKADPERATANLVKLHPNLVYSEEIVGVKASLADFFPSGRAANRPWGWQVVKDWNRFGTWLFDHHVITDVNAVLDADTNELLAGQGV